MTNVRQSCCFGSQIRRQSQKNEGPAGEPVLLMPRRRDAWELGFGDFDNPVWGSRTTVGRTGRVAKGPALKSWPRGAGGLSFQSRFAAQSLGQQVSI